MKKKYILLLVCLMSSPATLMAEPNDFVLDGVYEAALDIPRIYFLFQRGPNDLPIEFDGNFELNYAFLDTGASGMVLSRETVELMELALDPNAQFADVGVTGSELFNVTEPLLYGLGDLEAVDPYITENYIRQGPWRAQAQKLHAEVFPFDIIGMPAMAGKVAIFHAGATNELGFFAASIREIGDPAIPEVDFQVPLRMENFNTPNAPENIPPLPILAYNPVIDNVITTNNGQTATGTWLLDTGASLSFISSEHAVALGLIDPNGESLETPILTVAVGGVGGGQILVPVHEISSLRLPTLSGFDLVYNDARVGILDVSVLNEHTGEFITLHGVYGSNFLCASAALDTFVFYETVFEWIVVDFQNGLLGFDVIDDPNYVVPEAVGAVCGSLGNPWPAGDFDRDCNVGLSDLRILSEHWLTACNRFNWFCGQADVDFSGGVNQIDFAYMATSP